MTDLTHMTKKISLALIFILICLFILTVGQFTPIEIGFGGVSFVIYATIFIGLPIVFYAESKCFYAKLKTKTSRLIGTIIIVLFWTLGTFYVPIFCFGKFMCGNLMDKTLFTKNDIFNTKIIVRHYDCGAYDSDFPKEEIVNIRNIFGLFNFVTDGDTAHIDKTKWKRIN